MTAGDFLWEGSETNLFCAIDCPTMGGSSRAAPGDSHTVDADCRGGADLRTALRAPCMAVLKEALEAPCRGFVWSDRPLLLPRSCWKIAVAARARVAEWQTLRT